MTANGATTLEDLEKVIAQLRPVGITGIVCHEDDLVELILAAGLPPGGGPVTLARMGISVGISPFLPRGYVLKYGGSQAEAWVKQTVHELWKIAPTPPTPPKTTIRSPETPAQNGTTARQL